MKQFDWNKPQRQPLAGLAIVFLNTFWQVLKALWPLLLLLLFGNEENGVNKYEIMALGFLGFTIISAILRFYYFRFYIEGDKLIIKSGWFKKETKIIPLEKIQTVHIEQGPLHQLLNIVKLSIDTAGSQKAEAKIDALYKAMAEALKSRLESEKNEQAPDATEKTEFKELIIRLTGKDLLRLSVTANHVEAFFIILSFSIGVYENLTDIDNRLFSGILNFLPRDSVYPILFLVVSILLITILVSTARIFFRFYDLTVLKTAKGYQIKSGLINVKEKLIAFKKVQFVSWKANWIRKLLHLWTLEYHIAGVNEVQQNVKVQIPVTQDRYIGALVKNYFELPDIREQIAVHIHPSFVMRRLLIYGLFPSVIIMILLWLLWGQYALLFLLYPIFVLIAAWCEQRKFRLWALDDILHIKRGILGEKRILIQWHKLQSIQINQSVYQRQNDLANLVIYTAGGSVTIPFIPLASARQLLNFALHKTESSNKHWL